MEKCECPNCGHMCEVEYDENGFTGIIDCDECGEQEIVYSIYDEIQLVAIMSYGGDSVWVSGA